MLVVLVTIRGITCVDLRGIAESLWLNESVVPGGA
jgi:hypothetical protein